MTPRAKSRFRLVLALAAIPALVAGIVLLWRRDSLPRPGSKPYEAMVSAFFAGVAALDADANDQARSFLGLATKLVPEEPAAWANLGLVELRQGDVDAAARELEKARTLAPGSGAIQGLLGLLEGRRGRFAEEIAHLRRAVELDPGDLRSRFALGQELERQGEAGGAAESLRLMGAILETHPENLAVLIERARLAAKQGDAEALRDTISRLDKLSAAWPPSAQAQLRALAQAAAGPDLRPAATRAVVLRNLLVTTPAFRKSLAAAQPPIGLIGEPIETFLKLRPPPPTPAPPDEAITFAAEPPPAGGAPIGTALVAVTLRGEGPPALFVTDGRAVRAAGGSMAALPFPGGPEAKPPGPDGIAAADWNSDYAVDLALAGAGGLRFFRQEANGGFADATASTGLGADVLGGPAAGIWAADVDLDGDLDFVVGASAGPPLVLRNHGDGTFGVLKPFDGVAQLRGFAWADLDGDGDPDAALLDGRGKLLIAVNERSGRFRTRPEPAGLGRVVAIAPADADGDGTIDLLALNADGTIFRISDRDDGRAWTVAEVDRGSADPGGEARLLVADLDNNGALDLLVTGRSGTRISLGDDSGRLRPMPARADLRTFAAVDLDGDGRLDLAGLSADGRLIRAMGRGAKAYHWQVVRPRAARTEGDGRINSFGIGGEVDVRSGLLVQKQVIAGPALHFGLGTHPGADVTRVVWPNGTVQAEFQTKADRTIVAEQRLKGSCPFVYAFDGKAVRFVTDFLWRSPLGLRINAQDTANVARAEDRVKIRGDQLAPRDGVYDVRITAELWETHYFDHVALEVVDHPAGTEIFVDERFVRQPPALDAHATGPARPVVYARDDRGRDVTDLVQARDARYLDTFGRGPYQGVTRDHWVEVEVGADAPADRKLWLVAQGWVHPTDSSINVALGQGRHEPPRGLALEVPTADGRWEVARPDLGFPAGKLKTILIDLDGVFRSGAPRRLRLRTNLEIYWDALAVAPAEDRTPLRTRRLAPASAELRPRGYSRMSQADASSPELPEYNHLDGTTQRWRDLIGLYTRFGDVRELIAGVDDRYVIANAGDELALHFPAPDPPPSGWVRDFVLIGDGWNKDGDYNTAYSRTVLPLPSHDRPAYDTPPGALEDDPVYRRHPGDWRDYHTRDVTPGGFQDRLRPRASGR